jgi:hypothetical protein
MSELSVILDSTVVLQIIQHCQDSNDFTCGKLIGYESEGKLIVVNSFAIPSDLADSDEFTAQRLKYFQDLKFESFVLGWYLKVAEGENLDLTSLEHQYNLQCEFPRSVMLVYHAGKTIAAELPFTAYTLTEAFMNFFSEDDYSNRKNVEIGLTVSSVFQKMQVKLEVSELVEGFLAQYSEQFSD